MRKLLLCGEPIQGVRINDDKYEQVISFNMIDTGRYSNLGIDVDFLFDKDTNRYYSFEASNNLHDKQMDGAIVKKRMSKKAFEGLLILANEFLAEKEVKVEDPKMKLKDIKTLVEVSEIHNIPLKTLQSRLKHLNEDVEYKKLGRGQSTILSPKGINKITK